MLVMQNKRNAGEALPTSARPLAFKALSTGIGLWLTVFSATASEPNTNSVAAEQSPINISLDGLKFERSLPALQFRYPSAMNLDCANNGEIVRCAVPAGAAELKVGDQTYRLVQFHWHTSSEHRFFGLTFPMEMHLVHTNAAGQLLVVGVWFVPGQRNRELAKVFDRLPAVQGNSTAVASFNLNTLIPRSRQSFRYNGSLTTPPFTEGVKWVVLDDVARASWNQFSQHLTVFPGGNARDPQPLNGRIVSTDIGSNIAP